MKRIVGRTDEINSLSEYMASGQAEFVALYGRRRVGKTFLVTSYFDNKFAFDTTGVIGGDKKEELKAFCTSLAFYGYDGKQLKSWMDAFAALRTLLEKRRKKGRCVVFIDELPCFDTPKSGFVHAFDYFWNSWASRQDNFFLIVCGSATSWMVRNIIDNHGGLHNRITHELHLHPFTLKETEIYLKSRKFRWNRMMVLQCYMMFGGVPYYLSLLNANLGFAENVDKLFFSPDAELRREYHRLYKSLYRNPDRYMEVVELLSESKKGLTRSEIAEKLKVKNNGHLSDMLEDLVNCDFVRRYNVTEKRVKSNGGIYQLMDFYTLFYHAFVKRNKTDQSYWSHTMGRPIQNTWFGLTYEKVCMAHIPQLLNALHLDKIHVEYYSWRSREAEEGAQIDLILDRADDMIDICEVKYSQNEYVLTKHESERIANRVGAFQCETQTQKGVQVTMITTKGLKKNSYFDFVQNVVNLEDMFV